MPATLIWNDSFSYQQPEPVETTMTVTYALDVPSFTPTGVPYLFGVVSLGPKWGQDPFVHDQDPRNVYWRSNATGERQFLTFAGNNTGFITFYYPVGVLADDPNLQGLPNNPDLFLADGGSIEIDVTYYSPSDFYTQTYQGITNLPEWAEPAWEKPNIAMVALMWDVVGMYLHINSTSYGAGVVVEGINNNIPSTGGFGPGISNAPWAPAQTLYENAVFEWPVWGFDPANDTAWTMAFQSMQPQALAQNVGDSGTVDEGTTTFYSANMITQYSTDSGQVANAGALTDVGLYELQLPVNSASDSVSILQNYHFLNPKYYGMPYDIESHVDFQSPEPLFIRELTGTLNQPLNGSVAAQTLLIPWGFNIDPTIPQNFVYTWNFLPSGIFIQMPAGTVTLLGYSGANSTGSIIWTGPDQPFDLDTGTGIDILFGTYSDSFAPGVVSLSIKLTITRAQLASGLGIVRNTFANGITLNKEVAVPASGDVTFNLNWMTVQTVYDFNTNTFTTTTTPLQDPIAWQIPASSHTNNAFQRVSFYSTQENFVPVPENPQFGPSIAYNFVVGQDIGSLPDPTLSYALDIISASLMLYSGGQQIYTTFIANGARMKFPVYYPPMNWLGVGTSGFVAQVPYFTDTVDTVIDDNTVTLVNPAPTTVGNSWNYEAVSFTDVNGSRSGLLLYPSVDIPPSATHVMVDIQCDLDPANTVDQFGSPASHAGQVGVRVVGIGSDNVITAMQSGQVMNVFTSPVDPTFYEIFPRPDWGTLNANNQNTIWDLRWYCNSDSPVHRLCRFNTGSATQNTYNTQVNIYVDNPLSLGVNFSVNFQFFRLEPIDTISYGNVSVMPQDPANTPTIQDAPDSMPGWQDQMALAVPDGNFVAAQWSQSDFVDLWAIFATWNTNFTDADLASEVAVFYGETPGVITQTATPDEPFFAAQTNLTSTIYSLNFRQFPQSTCTELGMPAGCGFMTTYAAFNNVNPGPPTPVTLDPSLVVTKAYASKSSTFTSSAITAFLMTDGTVWCGGIGGFSSQSPWGQSGWDYVPRPLTVFQEPPTNLPPMIDMELCFFTTIGSSFDLLMLDALGNLWAYGFNTSREFGTGPHVSGVPDYILYPDAPRIIATNVTAFHGTGDSVAYVSNGIMYVAGNVQFGTLGLPVDFRSQGITTVDTFTPVPGLSGIRQITSFANNGSGLVVLDNAGTVWGWIADNTVGQLGASNYQAYNATGTNFYGPKGFWVPVPELGSGNVEIQAINTNGGAIYTRTRDGQVLMTGAYDSHGNAGDGITATNGNTRNRPPIQILLPDGVTAVQLAVPKQGMSLVASDGQCYAWGDNSAGALGQGTIDTLPHPTPTPIPNVPIGTTGIFRGLLTTIFYNGAITPPPAVTTMGGQVIG